MAEQEIGAHKEGPQCSGEGEGVRLPMTVTDHPDIHATRGALARRVRQRPGALLEAQLDCEHSEVGESTEEHSDRRYRVCLCCGLSETVDGGRPVALGNPRVYRLSWREAARHQRTVIDDADRLRILSNERTLPEVLAEKHQQS